MLTEKYFGLIEFFRLFIWVMSGFAACLLLINLGVIARLCYSEWRHPRPEKCPANKKSLSP